jgi:hypothetical protein
MSSILSNYKEERLQKQIDWHSKKARHNKLRFRIYQIITLIASATIPVINIIEFADFPVRVISSIFAGIVLVVTGVSQLEKYQQNWILYRTTSELLKKEKYMFENDAGDFYNLPEPDKNKLLVERVESIVSAETSKYFAIHKPAQKKLNGEELSTK